MNAKSVVFRYSSCLFILFLWAQYTFQLCDLLGKLFKVQTDLHMDEIETKTLYYDKLFSVELIFKSHSIQLY